MLPRLSWRSDKTQSSASVARTSEWRWLYLVMTILLDLLCVFAVLQLVLASALFRLGDLPVSLIVGAVLTIFAVGLSQPRYGCFQADHRHQSFLTVVVEILHLLLSRRYRSTRGKRDRLDFPQNAFFRIITITATVWWVSALTGSYIFTRPIIACDFTSSDSVLGQAGTPCRLYQFSVCVSGAGWYVFSYLIHSEAAFDTDPSLAYAPLFLLCSS